ncbi:MAG: DegT/DnrJ/EryC1/StrS family aminotransferase [Bacteroidetes bacterium]|nr:MAG: DegT/DnrJ/EryC1/StrS family aminotransferase [Bacteroidota bacterium]
MIEYENLRRLNAPFFEEYKNTFNHFLESGWFVLGKQVKAFEEEFASYCKADFCVGLASGLDAIELALKSFNFKPNSEVIVPSNTYIASILAIVNVGLKPVLVEPNIKTYNIDPKLIEAKITSETVAILPVHLYGKCCEMDRIIEIAKKHQLKIVEDAAQAHGAMQNNKLTGTFGEFGAFSFYPTKNLGALGDAGGLICQDEEKAESIKTLRNYGSKIKYYNEVLGYNSRLDEVQAAFLRIKLKHLDQINNHKRSLAEIYFNGLSDQFIKPDRDPEFHDVFHIYNVRHPKRDQLKAYLEEHQVKTEVHYPVAPNNQKAMKGIINERFPIAEEIHRTTLSLPISYFHSEEDILQVVDIMNRFN